MKNSAEVGTSMQITLSTLTNELKAYYTRIKFYNKYSRVLKSVFARVDLKSGLYQRLVADNVFIKGVLKIQSTRRACLVIRRGSNEAVMQKQELNKS